MMPTVHRRTTWLPLLLVAGSVAGCEPAPPGAARQVLAGAHRMMGGEAVTDIAGLVTAADVRGPSSSFQTLIWSARDGRVRMEQTGGFVAGVDHAGGWVRDRTSGGVLPLDSATSQFVRGHELHALAVMPLTRLAAPELVAARMWDGDSALVVRFRDPQGALVEIAYGLRDTLPFGLRFAAQQPDVVVRLGQWSAATPVRLFRNAEFRQGDEVYRYEYSVLEATAVADSLFSSATAPQGPRPNTRQELTGGGSR